MTQLQYTQSLVDQAPLTDQQQKMLADLTKTARQYATRPPELDALVRSDRGISAGGLAGRAGRVRCLGAHIHPGELGVRYGWTGGTGRTFHADQLTMAIAHVNATYTAYNLLAEIGQGAGRISEIVKALKSYSFL